MENKGKPDSQAIEYNFIPVPKEIYYNPELAKLPADAKHLFILIIDRIRLSEKNIEHFSDINGKAFVYLTVKEVSEKLCISEKFAIKMFDSLLKAQLIAKKRQGCGKPNRIQLDRKGLEVINGTFKNCTAASSEPVGYTVQELTDRKCNNNNISNNDFNNNQSVIYEMAIDEIKEQIDYDIIKADRATVDSIVEIMYDVMHGKGTTVRIGSNIYPKSAVCERFKKLSCEDIEDVTEALESSETPVRNVRSYLIAALYNAPSQSASKYSLLFAKTYKDRYDIKKTV